MWWIVHVSSFKMQSHEVVEFHIFVARTWSPSNMLFNILLVVGQTRGSIWISNRNVSSSFGLRLSSHSVISLWQTSSLFQSREMHSIYEANGGREWKITSMYFYQPNRHSRGMNNGKDMKGLPLEFRHPQKSEYELICDLCSKKIVEITKYVFIESKRKWSSMDLEPFVCY